MPSQAAAAVAFAEAANAAEAQTALTESRPSIKATARSGTKEGRACRRHRPDAVSFAKGLVERQPELVFAFHEGDFTLTELQQTYAALAGEKYAPENKRNFRLWVSNFGDGAGLVEETGKMKTGSHRPAKLYRPNRKLFG